MISAYRNMFAILVITFLCLMSVSHSAPLACKDLLRPFDQLDPHELEGKWALVADSLKVIRSSGPVPLSDSVAIYFYNSTFSKSNRFGSACQYFSHNVSIESPHYNFQAGQFNFSGTLFRTSCSDCVVLTFNVESPDFATEELCLFSKRRQVDEKELREFKAQVDCLKMPQHVVMDPTEQLCPAVPRQQKNPNV